MKGTLSNKKLGIFFWQRGKKNQVTNMRILGLLKRELLLYFVDASM